MHEILKMVDTLRAMTATSSHIGATSGILHLSEQLRARSKEFNLMSEMSKMLATRFAHNPYPFPEIQNLATFLHRHESLATRFSTISLLPAGFQLHRSLLNNLALTLPKAFIHTDFIPHLTDESLEDIDAWIETVERNIPDQDTENISDAELREKFNAIEHSLNEIKTSQQQSDKASADERGSSTKHIYIGYLITALTILYSWYCTELSRRDADATDSKLEEVLQSQRRLKSAINDFVDSVTSQKLDTARRTTRCPTNLRSSPTDRSELVRRLPSGFTLKTLTYNHKWVLILVLPEDELPYTGWVMKKHLVKP
jgi:hypothetical protein